MFKSKVSKKKGWESMFKAQDIKQTAQKGFTLLEVLLVVAIIAILAGIVIIAINPGKNLADARNSQRSADVTTILNAVHQYALDNNGTLPTSITNTPVEICSTGATPCTSLTDLSSVTTGGKYIATMPKDPQCPAKCATNGAGYMISTDTNGRVVVSAPDAENKTISVTR